VIVWRLASMLRLLLLLLVAYVWFMADLWGAVLGKFREGR
jgi:hypothetical protein